MTTVEGVELSHPAKELLPGLTKADLAQYLVDVSPVMLPHLRGRPVNMQRLPEGLGGPSFYEKRVPKHFPGWLATVEVETHDGPQRQVVVDDVRSLVYLAQQNCVTPHTWLCTDRDLDRPDQLVIDLDPTDDGPDTLRKVRRATRLVGELLTDLGLTTYLRTTGSRGYHVLVPLRRDRSFEEVRAFARACAERLVEAEPALLTLEQRKADRGDRVYVDVLRNGYGQTAVPAYAVRARERPTVAVPITWDELSRVRPDQHDVASVRRRLARRTCPWSGLRGDAQGLGRAVQRLGRH